MGTPSSRLIAAIEAVLPQTQCRRCGHAGCRAYAVSLAAGEASPDACPPGGEHTRRTLASLVGRELQPARPLYAEIPSPSVARILESDCIGCARCLAACPVDVIVGAAGLLHGVVAECCTGCGLCVPVCPTDCIDVQAEPRAGSGVPSVSEAAARAREARRRYEARAARRERHAPGSAAESLVDAASYTSSELRERIVEAVRRRQGHDRRR